MLDRIEHDLGTADRHIIELPYRDLVLRASSVAAVSGDQRAGPEPAP